MADTVTSMPKPVEKTVQAQSTIQFPYGDLDDAMAVASAITKLGAVACDADQLAAAMGQAPTSGSFRGKIHTARTFGAIETVQGKYQLTNLGFALTDKAQERAARADAFLRVPLYRRVYDEFRNKQLPPSNPALERAMITFGVVPTQVERARQAFQRSAQQAGYFDTGGRDRLVRPPVGTTSTATEGPSDQGAPEPTADYGGSNGGNGGSGGRGPVAPVKGAAAHPFVQGLLGSLPEPDTNWATEGRAKWLEAAAKVFDLMYKGDGNLTVQVIQSKRATE